MPPDIFDEVASAPDIFDQVAEESGDVFDEVVAEAPVEPRKPTTAELATQAYEGSLEGTVKNALIRGTGDLVSSVGGAMSMAPDVSGIGKLTTSAGLGTPGEWVTNLGRSITGIAPKATTGTFEPSNPSWWEERLPEVVPQLAGQLGIAAVTGGGSLAFGIAGGAQMAGSTYNEAKEDLLSKNVPSEEAHQRAAAEGAVVGTIGAFLEKIPGAEYLTKGPIGGFLQKAIRSKVASNAVAGTLSEAGTEMAQELVSIGAEAAARGKEFTLEEIKARLGASGTLGAAAGGIVGAVTSPIERELIKAADAADMPLTATALAEGAISVPINQPSESDKESVTAGVSSAGASNLTATPEKNAADAKMISPQDPAKFLRDMAERARTKGAEPAAARFEEAINLLEPEPATEPAPEALQAIDELEALLTEDEGPTPMDPQAEVDEGTARPIPVKGLTLSDEVPQFKAGANEKGLVEPLTGKWDDRGVGPIQVWERMDGRREVISGRHRLDLAQREGVENISAQIYKESEGFTAGDAATLDAELNIRDGHGSAADYAQYFKHANLTEKEAADRGLLGRAKGRQGFVVGTFGSPDVTALHRAGALTDAQAEAIAIAAPGNAAAQRIGTRAALDGRSAADVRKIVGRSLNQTGQAATPADVDLFGENDAAMQKMAEEAKLASAAQKEIRAQITAVEGAAKNPAAAKKLNVDVKDPAAILKRVAELRAEEQRWEKYWNHPDLLAKAEGKESAPAPMSAPLPKLRRGEKQGDLLATQTEDLKLVGEKGVDTVQQAKDKAAAEKASKEAKAKQKKEQTDFIGDALDKAIDALESKPGELFADPFFIKSVGKPALRAALQVVRVAYKAGKSLAQAIEDGIAHLRVNVADLDEAKAREFFKSVSDSIQTSAEPQDGGTPVSTATAEAAKPEAAGTGRQTSTKNAVMEAERAARGAAPIDQPARQSLGVPWDEAGAILERNANAGAELVKEMNESPRAVTDVEEALLLRYKITLQNSIAAEAKRAFDVKQSEGARAEALINSQRLLDQADALDLATKAVGTEWGRAGRFRQLLASEDFTLATMLTRATVAKNGEPLSEKESEQIVKLSEELEETRQKLQALEEQRLDAEVQDHFTALLADIKKEAKTAVKGKKSATDFFNKQAEDARARIRARAGNLNLALNPLDLIDHAIIGASYIANGITAAAEWSAAMIKDFGEAIRPHLADIREKSDEFHAASNKLFTTATKPPKKPSDVVAKIKVSAEAGEGLDKQLIGQLVRSHVIAGVEGIEAVMKAVHADLVPIFPGVTEREIRDIFSGYGKATFPSKDEIDIKVRELHRLGQLVSAIEDAQRKIAPLKSGPQREKASQAIREMQTRLNDEIKKAGIETVSPERQLASRNEARKTALRNQIEDLDKQLQTGEKPDRGAPVPDSPEVERLKRERDAMKELLQEIEEAENPPPSPEELGIKAAERARERWDKILKGELEPQTREPYEPKSEREAAIRAEVAAMREAAAELRRQARPKKDPEAAREKRELEAIDKAIAEYERRARELDFDAKPKRQGPITAKVAAARAVRDAAKAAFDAIKKASKPTRTPDQIRLDSNKAAIKARIAKLEAKIAAGDYTVPAKKTPLMDKEKRDLQFKEAKIKERFMRGVFEERLKQRDLSQKTKDFIADTFHTLRSIMTGGELSGLLRQGKFSLLSRPITTLTGATPAMFRAFKSEAHEKAEMDKISLRKNAPIYRSSGLAINDPNDFTAAQLEGNYRSRWANKIPIISGSGRAYTVFLNRLRADVFDVLSDTLLDRRGIMTDEEAKALATFINENTGAGGLGVKGKKAAQLLNVTFFSPKYAASRFQMLVGHSLWGGTKNTRRIIATEYARAAVGAALVYALYSAFRDDEDEPISLDPQKSDFGKIQYGNTRVDPMAGMIQVSVFLSRLLPGLFFNATPEGIRELAPEFFGEVEKLQAKDPDRVLFNFLRSKLSPIPGAFWDRVKGEDYKGDPVTWQGQALSLGLPMTWGDMLEAIHENGAPKGLALAVLAFFGEGLNTYTEKEKKPDR